MATVPNWTVENHINYATLTAAEKESLNRTVATLGDYDFKPVYTTTNTSSVSEGYIWPDFYQGPDPINSVKTWTDTNTCINWDKNLPPYYPWTETNETSTADWTKWYEPSKVWSKEELDKMFSNLQKKEATKEPEPDKKETVPPVKKREPEDRFSLLDFD